MSSIVKLTACCLFVMSTLWFPLSARAGHIAVAAVEPREQQSTFRIGVGYMHRFETDIDDGGEVELDGVRVGIGAEVDLTENLSWDNYVPYEFNSYDFSGLAGFGWEDVHAFGLVSMLKYSIAPEWHAYGGGMIRYLGEEGADFGDALIGGGLLGLNFVHSPTLIYGLGIGIISQIEDDAAIIPIPTLQWRFADDWMLTGGLSELASRIGVGAEVSWGLSDRWSLAGGAQFQTARFRLDDKGPNKDGVAQDSSVPLYAKLTWQPNPATSIETIFGAAVGGQLRVENDRGHKIAEEDYDPAPMLGVRAQFAF